MSFNKAQKVGTVTLLALSIAACSNGHHHRTFQKPTVTPTAPNQTDAQKQAEAKAKAEAEAKRLAEEAAKKKAEAERLAKEKAEAEAKAKAEAERKAKEEAARKAAEEKARQEAEAKAKAEAEAKAKAEAERKAKEEAARKAAEEKARQEAEAKRLAEEKRKAEEAAKAKAEAERLAKEKAEAEAKAKAEAERKAKEEAAKKAAEEKARQEAEAKRLAEEKAKRDAKIAELTKKATDAGLSAEQIANYANDNVDKSDADAKTALDAIVKQNRDAKIADLAKKATDAGLPKAQADNYANAQVDATDADAKTALDKLLADRQAIKDDLKQKALDAGLSDRYSQKYADDNVDTASDKTQAALNQTIKSATVAEKGTSNTTQGLDDSRTEISSSTIGSSGLSCISSLGCSTFDTRETTRYGNLNLSYNQEYSIVKGEGSFTEKYRHASDSTASISDLHTITVKGLETQDAHVPTIGRAAYTGEAFSLLTGDGKFDYLVNFDKRTGSGKITGFNVGTLELAEGELTKVNLDGKSVTGVSSKIDGSASGDYTLGLYGTKAQEIAGKGNVSDGETYQIGFGGKQNAERLAEIEKEEKIADLTKQATEAGLTQARVEAFVNDNVKSSAEDAATALQVAVDKLAADKAALIEQAKNVGIGDELAKQYADANVDTATDELKSALEETAKEQAKVEKAKLKLYPEFDAANYPSWMGDRWAQELTNFTNVNEEGQVTDHNGVLKIYQKPYSIVVFEKVNKDIRNGEDLTEVNQGERFYIEGLATTEKSLPTEGKAIYIGRVFEYYDEQTLSYTVDFGKRTGSGRLVGYTDTGIINLNEANITKLNLKGKDVLGISGDATLSKIPYWANSADGKYALGFFGPEAQEIAGFAEFGSQNDSKHEYGFGGTRGEIKK